MNSKGKGTPIFPLLAIGAGVVVVMAVLGVFGDLSGIIPGGQPAAIVFPTATQIPGCSSNTTPELQLVALDRINAGTSRTDEVDANVFINGTFYKGFRLSSDSTIDVSPGDGYTIFFTGVNNNHDVLGAVATGNVPCEELSVVNVTVAQTGTMNLTAWNDDDGLANSGGDTQAISNGETVNVEFEIKENTADKCLGSADSELDLGLCIDYNSSTIKSPVVKLNGASLPSLAIPEGHSSVKSSTGGTSAKDTTVCVVLTGYKEVCDYAKLEGFSIQLEGKSSASPNGTGSDDLNVFVYQPQVYKNSETGEWTWTYSNTVDANALIMPEKAKIYLG